jgi:phage terminase small subunit
MADPALTVTPRHLRAATRRWMQSVLERWELEEHHRRLLQLAGEAWDRGQRARAQLATDGLTVETKAGGPRLHPCVKVQEQAEIAFARLVRELDLDIDPPAEARRPPVLRSMRG